MRLLIFVFCLCLMALPARAVEYYALNTDDGGVFVMELLSGTPEEAITKAPWGDRVTEVTRISADDRPTDYTYREAWTFHDGKFGIDAAKAQQIDRKRLVAKLIAFVSAIDLRAVLPVVLFLVMVFFLNKRRLSK